ncbi:hypothetical protein Q31b_25910 [Novipirellula aureliae]|uniref:Uncharacterized protein n=1 Tax=Novipirellula aureliae TaxID=2527966 RepID=A0A5C6E405_9BACT|nr:hypothetical protein [Novipirellula aureliae]TWU43550.1 hypothetical protein Q31b_25910 [Novipirellula aureliae]
MIEPRSDLSPRSERPPLDAPFWMHAVVPFASLFAKRLRRQYDVRVERSGLLLQSALECANRQQLEELLGQPRYAMLGDHYGTSDSVDGPISGPDLVEIYERDGCMVEVWFKDGKWMTMNGMAFPTNWEFLSGAMNASEP